MRTCFNGLYFDKTSRAAHEGTRINFEYQQLAEELHRPITTTIKKLEVNLSFKDNIWGADASSYSIDK